MKKLIKAVFITNIIAVCSVGLLSNYIAFFSSTRLIDFLFYVVLIIWGLAGLTWDGSNKSRGWDTDFVAMKAKSMVSGHDFESAASTQRRQNYQFGLVMFISGIPALTGCIILFLFD